MTPPQRFLDSTEIGGFRRSIVLTGSAGRSVGVIAAPLSPLPSSAASPAAVSAASDDRHLAGLPFARVPGLQHSAPGRIRTCGTRFRKPMLYPLSYGGWGL